MKTDVVILAAGQGKRMGNPLPKPLIPLLGKPIIEWILDTLDSVEEVVNPIIVVGHEGEKIREALAHREVTFVDQAEQFGTGHALLQCLDVLNERQADRVLVLMGDVPLISPDSLQIILSQESEGVVVAFEAENPEGYGRIILGQEGGFSSIVEDADATDEEKDISLVNSGIYLLPFKSLDEKLSKIEKNNSQQEIYLTEVPADLAREGASVAVVELMDPLEAAGINTPIQFTELTQEAKSIVLGELLHQGVLIDDPTTTWIEADVSLAPGARVMPFTVIRRGVKIAESCVVGPFAHVREGTVLESGAEIGNFTEVKGSKIGENSKAKHLSYVGDAVIGSGVNIGAGTVFANYDGQHKHSTKVEDDVFIGSGTILVAPVKVGRNARTGAGAIVTSGRDVASGETVVGVPAKPISSKNVKGT